MIRKIILSVLGILLVVGAIVLSKRMVANKEQRQPKPEAKLVTGAFSETVNNTSTPISITTSGNLAAKNKVDLFAEVQGLFSHSSRAFKPGTFYKEGEILLQLDKTEETIALKAAKSSFYNQLVLLLPDLRFDYADAAGKWENYIRNFDVNSGLPPLPEPSSEKEKLFLVGRNIYTTYYNVLNQETQLRNYVIYAPFSGVLTEALVNKGSLIRPGQRLGQFIDQNYELEVAVNTSYADLVSIGKIVKLHNVSRTKSWNGKVVRVNSLVDPTSQTIPTYIQVSGKGLKEGMYLEADISAKAEQNTYEINRKLLVDNNKLFVVKDSVLQLVTVEPIYFKESTAVIRGLANGTEVLTKTIPGAYEGMRVKTVD